MSKVTPRRRTHVVFDEPRPCVAEPPFSFTKSGSQVWPSSPEDVQDLVYIPEVGWRLASFTYEVDQQAMTGQGHEGIQTLDLAPGHFVVPTFGLDPAGTYDGTVASGNVAIQKRVAAGQPYGQMLLSDATAEPVPGLASMLVPLDRVARTPSPTPDTLRDFHFDIVINRGSHDGAKEAASLQFYGPVGNSLHPKAIGTGHYCLTIHFNGSMILTEQLESKRWKTRDRWKFKVATSLQKLRVTIHLTPPEVLPQVKYGQIVFVSGYPASNPNHEALSGGSVLARKAGVNTDDTDFHVFTVPGFGSAPPMANGPQRINITRNSRPQFQLIHARYRASGNLLDPPQSLPFLTLGGDALTLTWRGEQPVGSTMSASLIDAGTLLELTLLTSAPWTKTYLVPPGFRSFRVKIALTSATGLTTPTLSGFRVTKEGSSTLTAPGAWELDSSTSSARLGVFAVTDVSIFGPTRNPRDSHAMIKVHDFLNQTVKLQNRGQIALRIETEYALDPVKRCVLHRGTIQGPSGVRPVRRRKGFADHRAAWSIESAGMWSRLERASCPFLWCWGDPDPGAPLQSDGSRLPYKATDAIWYMLQWAGFPPEMLNISDLPLRVPRAAAREVVVEPLSRLNDVILRVARRFLGMKLVFMDNWGEYGQWTLRSRLPMANVPLVRFLQSGAPAGRVQESIASYPLGPGGEVTCPIFAGSLKTWTVPLSFNRLVVTSTTTAGGDRESKMRQIWHNFDSFNFLSLPVDHPRAPRPDHPDFVGEVVEAQYVDADLDDGTGSGIWVNWLTRRLADALGHTRRGVTFDAPLVILADPQQAGRRRPLTVEDLVAVDLVPYYVMACNPHYHKDDVQTAEYQLMRA